MKKKILYGLFIFILVVILLNVVVIVISTLDGVNRKNDPVKKQEKKVIPQLVCTYTDKDDFNYTIRLTFQDNKLITKTDTFSWEDKEKETCDYYKKRLEVYNKIEGIVDTIDCDDHRGERTTVYTIANLDRVLAKIAELKYINQDDTFDFEGYKQFRTNDGYYCTDKVQ